MINLNLVQKPLRYIDHELNAFHKDFTTADVRFCFIYPDVYEIGISHLGLKILYSIINQTPDAMADRCYTPWATPSVRRKTDGATEQANWGSAGEDCGDLYIKTKTPLIALESKVPLKDFDCLGFTLATELIYTNILYTLDLAQIPLRVADRDDTHPIVIAGGINAVNPHPLSLFIDAFFIGEAEEGILVIKDILKQEKSRAERLKALADLEYIYVPTVQTSIDTQSSKTQKALHASFATSTATHFPQLVPLLQSTHDRHTAEIMRGCTRGCRFCQAGMFYRPVREKAPDIIIEQAFNDIKISGWDSIGLLSLSSSDYTHIVPLLQHLSQCIQGFGVSLSLPSLRIDTLDNPSNDLIQYLKKSGITLAPEAGTQRLRDIINKNLTEDEILNAIRYAQNAGARLIKLYFMIGLPFETDEDIDGIISLVERIISPPKTEHRAPKPELHISLSPFVPKPMTPFQWAKMDSENEVLTKALKIKHTLSKYRNIKINYHTIELSFLEAVLCRGDDQTSYVVERAYQNGAKFDAWREHFDYNIWLKSAEEVDYDWYKPIKGYYIDDPLPWDNISICVSKDFLKNEYIKAQQALTTPDCRTGKCNKCGMRNSCFPQNIITQKNLPHSSLFTLHSPLNTPNSSLYRVYFSKLNDLKYLSHLDFLRLIHRLLMISDLPIAFSQGFNPHPKTSFCPPLSSGIEGENEFFDVWLLDFPASGVGRERLSTEKVLSELSKTTIKDLHFHKAILLCEDAKYSQGYIPISQFEIETIGIDFSNAKHINIIKAIDNYNKKHNITITKERKGKEKQINLKEIIIDIYSTKNNLTITKKINGASIYDIIETVFDIPRHDTGNLRIIRKNILTHNNCL